MNIWKYADIINNFQEKWCFGMHNKNVSIWVKDLSFK
jgi:hypothetical protein